MISIQSKIDKLIQNQNLCAWYLKSKISGISKYIVGNYHSPPVAENKKNTIVVNVLLLITTVYSLHIVKCFDHG